MQPIRKFLEEYWYIFILGGLFLFWSWSSLHGHGSDDALSSTEKFEITVSGQWMGITSHKTLNLNRDNYVAVLTLDQSKDTKIESQGSWYVDQSVVMVSLAGAAGQYHLALELVESDIANFLTPTPVATGRLIDSFIEIEDYEYNYYEPPDEP